METFAQPAGEKRTAEWGGVLPPLPLETFAKPARGLEWVKRGGFRPLSRWERVGVRAGGGGGRTTLPEPAPPVTQSSP